MMPMKLGNISILKIHGVDYRCVITVISIGEDIKLMQNIDLSKRMEHYKI